jgi:AcrR family transcriptional regulator
VTGMEAVSETRTQRRAAICDAVFQLLAEVGYDKMTMDAVAARARASKATIYRTWPDKPSLVAETLRAKYAEGSPIPDTGSLRGDLMALLGMVCTASNSIEGEVMTGIVSAAVRDAELCDVVREFAFESKKAMHQHILDLAVARGEIATNEGYELLHEVIFAMISGHKITSNEPFDDEFARHVVDDIVIPLLKHHCACR